MWLKVCMNKEVRRVANEPRVGIKMKVFRWCLDVTVQRRRQPELHPYRKGFSLRRNAQVATSCRKSTRYTAARLRGQKRVLGISKSRTGTETGTREEFDSLKGCRDPRDKGDGWMRFATYQGILGRQGSTW